MQVQIIRINVATDVLKDLWLIIKNSWDEDFIDKTQKSFDTLHTHLTKIAVAYDTAKSQGSQNGVYVANREEAISLWKFLAWHLDEKIVTDPGKIAQVSSMLSNLALALDGKVQKIGENLVGLMPNSPTTTGLAVGSKKIDPVSHPDSEGNILEFPVKQPPDGSPIVG